MAEDNQNASQREAWTSTFGFILAATGSAVGLGNIWRFPYVVGTNGGAAFLVLYLVGTALIGYPILIAEMSLGKETQRNPIGAFKKLAPESPWWLAGAVGVFTGFVILSYYSVIAGWSIVYVGEALTGFNPDMDFAQVFAQRISGIRAPVMWHGVFMLTVVSIIRAGVIDGIQRIAEILMPLLLVLMIALAIRSITLPGAREGLGFYLSPNFERVTSQTILDAIAQSFFTLSLGMGAIITYGSYLSAGDSISDSANYILLLDVFIALLSGFVIFPAVFALGFNPGSGPGLIFITLPAVFAEMTWGTLFGVLFFLLFVISAVTSATSLLEVVVAYFVDEWGWTRAKAAQIIGGAIFLIGIPPVLGYSVLEEVTFLGMNILDTYDWWANSVFLPLGGLLTSIFAGYVWGARNTAKVANEAGGWLYIGYWFELLLKYLVPAAVAVVMVTGIFF